MKKRRAQKRDEKSNNNKLKSIASKIAQHLIMRMRHFSFKFHFFGVSLAHQLRARSESIVNAAVFNLFVKAKSHFTRRGFFFNFSIGKQNDGCMMLLTDRMGNYRSNITNNGAKGLRLAYFHRGEKRNRLNVVLFGFVLWYFTYARPLSWWHIHNGTRRWGQLAHSPCERLLSQRTLFTISRHIRLQMEFDKSAHICWRLCWVSGRSGDFIRHSHCAIVSEWCKCAPADLKIDNDTAAQNTAARN